ncbi:uncharacterized protein LOC117715751 isoform X2 [Arvicanthis niloticus]|uniref:uncharacterized protein LOC117715751 isoform X2 n=1 Tax=Arvicanthis niloticus TaxID=61156 RepID=UPI00403D4B7A
MRITQQSPNHWKEHGVPNGGVRERTEGAEGVCNPIGRTISTNQTRQSSQGLNYQPRSTNEGTHGSSRIYSRRRSFRTSMGGEVLGAVKLRHSSERISSQDEEASMRLIKTAVTTTNHLEEEETDRKLQAKCHRIVFPESHARCCCCYGVIIVLTVAVVALSAALSVFRKTEQISIKNNTYAACQSNWIGVGNKCFYFSGYSSNWTSSQDSCMAQGAQLARIDSLEELDFLRSYKGGTDCWIGLHRESSEHPWRWTDNTEYNNWHSLHLGSSREATSRCFNHLSLTQTLLLDLFLLIYPQTVPQDLDSKETANSPKTSPPNQQEVTKDHNDPILFHHHLFAIFSLLIEPNWGMLSFCLSSTAQLPDNGQICLTAPPFGSFLLLPSCFCSILSPLTLLSLFPYLLSLHLFKDGFYSSALSLFLSLCLFLSLLPTILPSLCPE